MCVELRLFRMGWLLVLLLMAGMGCSGSNDDDDSTAAGDDDDSSPTALPAPDITLGAAEQSTEDAGVIGIHYTLFGYSGLLLELTATYSNDGLTFHPVTTFDGDDLTGKAASPEGTEYTLLWATLEDLGFVDKEVYFKLVGQGDGYEIEPDVIRVTVSNKQYDKPCLITVDPPTQQDGQIPITYHLMDIAGDTCNIQVKVALNGSAAGNPATASTSDPGDPLTGVDVPAEGITRRFVWDSETDIGPHDMDVTMTFTATDKNNTESNAVSISVLNDPAPGPGDVIFTEVMCKPDYGFPYLELFNTTNHQIDLSNIHLSGNNKSVVISADQSLPVLPKDYIVFSQVSTPENEAWTDYVIDSFAMGLRTDRLELWSGDKENKTTIDEMTYNIDDPSVDPILKEGGHAIALLPQYMTAGANDALTAWCAESTEPIPGFPEGAADCGSPGEPTKCTAYASTTTPTPAPTSMPSAATPTPAP